MIEALGSTSQQVNSQQQKKKKQKKQTNLIRNQILKYKKKLNISHDKLLEMWLKPSRHLHVQS